MALKFIFNPLSGMFDIVQNTGGAGLDSNTSLLRETVQVLDTSVLSIESPVILMIADGNAGRITSISQSALVEYK